MDNLLGGALANFTQTHVADWTSVGTPIAPYPDFVGCALIILVTIVISFGARLSSGVNNSIVVLNVLMLVFVSILGFIYSDIDNWTSEETGGFMPYGVGGVLAGSGACFWALTGFETVSSAAEEALTPRKSIPLATGIIVVLVTILYVTMSAAITLMTSYVDIDSTAPLPSAFQVKGIVWAQYVAAIGPMLGLMTMLLNCIYVSVRLVYAIAEDGLLPSIFSKVNQTTKVPLAASLLVGILTCLTTIFLDLEEILGFSIIILIGEHMAVAIGVTILRYRTDEYEDPTRGNEPASRPSRYRAIISRDINTSSGNENNGRITSKGNSDEHPPNKEKYQHENDDGPDPAMDIEAPHTHSQTSDESDEETQPRKQHPAGNFQWEDCEGEGFTTGDDEYTVFDARALERSDESQTNPDKNFKKNAAEVRFVIGTGSIGLNTSFEEPKGTDHLIPSNMTSTENTSLIHSSDGQVRLKSQFTSMGKLFQPFRGSWVSISMFLVFLMILLLAFLLFYGMNSLGSGTWWVILITCIICMLILLLEASIWIHQQNSSKGSFKVMFVQACYVFTG